jgi:tetratricopeptide (TPR) repeat protein
MKTHRADETADLERHLVAADAYLDLGMPRDALEELDAIGEAGRRDAQAMRLRVRAHLRLREWTEGMALASSAARRYPQDGEFFLQWAYALHKARPGGSAQEVLDAAPEPLRSSGLIHYNLARFEAQDGNIENARLYLQEACRLNPAVVFDARRDPLLRPVWN